MREHNFGYFFHEGLSSIISHGFMSFAAVGTTVACLLIMGTFTLVAVNANAQLKDLEQANEILAYVEEDYTTQQAKTLQKKIEALPGVTTATYITRAEAMTAFAEKYPEEELFQDLDPNILRDRYAIRIADLTRLNETVQSVEAIEGIARVNAYEELAGGFITIRNIAAVICIALMAILMVVSVFIISNTIKLTTFDRKEEIAIMKMVGATNGFIRWPFVYEGFILGLLGAIIAFFLQWGLYRAIAEGITANDTMRLLTILPFEQFWIPVAAIFVAAGIVIGVFGSLSAIHKFLFV